jgi:tetratricopeptide (TPR) repeat protein
MLPRSSAPLLVVFVALASSLFAQRPGIKDQRPIQDLPSSFNRSPGTGVLIFRLYAEDSKTPLDRQAVLKLVNHADLTALWQTTDGASQGIFTDIPMGDYEVEVSAAGYFSERKQVQLTNSVRPVETEILLHRDASAVSLDLASAIMSSKARKQAKRAILLMKSGNLAEAQQPLELAYRMSPSSPELNFLLGYLNFQKKDFARSANYLGMAATLSPHDVQSLIMLGRVGLERENYEGARSALEQAISLDAGDWVAHDLLAAVYLREKKYEQARNEAESAISKGKRGASTARLILADALIGLGRDADAAQSLGTFLNESPQHPLAGEVRTLLARLKDRNSVAEPEALPDSEIRVSGSDSLAVVSAPALSLKSWKPPGIDDIKLPVAPDVRCPTEQVLEESGKRVEELVQDVERFAAVEDLFHERLDNYGIPIRKENRKYDYVATISEPRTGILNIDEFRSDEFALGGYPDQIETRGFAVLALVFHPHRQNEFEMTCEGLGDWRGQATWLMHFRQRSDRPKQMQAFNIGDRSYSIGLKGRAWISADKFQIVRIEAEIADPMPEIQLLSEHQVVEYGPVPFPRKNTNLWLPKTAEIYLDFRKRHYHRRHSFDHYMLYSVDTEEKRKEPVAPPAEKQSG